MRRDKGEASIHKPARAPGGFGKCSRDMWDCWGVRTRPGIGLDDPWDPFPPRIFHDFTNPFPSPLQSIPGAPALQWALGVGLFQLPLNTFMVRLIPLIPTQIPANSWQRSQLSSAHGSSPRARESLAFPGWKQSTWRRTCKSSASPRAMNLEQ